MEKSAVFLKSKTLDKKPFFNFTFLTHNAKNKTIDKIFDKIYRVSQLKMQEWKQLGRQNGGYNYIEEEETNIFFKFDKNVLNFIKENFDEEWEKPPNKYIYFRVGDVERMYGFLIENYFIAIFLDCSKEAQK